MLGGNQRAIAVATVRFRGFLIPGDLEHAY